MEFETGSPTFFVEDVTNSFILRLFITFIVTAATLLPAALHVHRDYLAFLALGPGGTPSTVPGYLRIKALSLVALRDPYQPGLGLKERAHGFLHHLTQRRGARPETKGIAPQRQMTQKSSKEMYAKLNEAVEALASSTSGLTVRTSCFEKHSTGLFATSPINKTCNGEICHAHPSDGSLHLTLHPADADKVLTAGWGERHPLARGGWFERFVPHGFLMIYAPRDDKDLVMVLEIVKAAIWHVCEDGDQEQFNNDKSKFEDVSFCRTGHSAIVDPIVELGAQVNTMRPPRGSGMGLAR